MKKLAPGLMALVAIALLASESMAQRQSDREGRGSRRNRQSQREARPDRPANQSDRRMPRRPPNPLMVALDVDKDGTLSAEEIAKAVDALKTLDKDGDGTLSQSELQPPRGMRGSPWNPEAFVERWKGFDTDGDGKISKEERPDWMERLFNRVDTNEDGFVDGQELEAASKMMAERGARSRGGRATDRTPGRRRRPAPSEDDADDES